MIWRVGVAVFGTVAGAFAAFMWYRDAVTGGVGLAGEQLAVRLCRSCVATTEIASLLQLVAFSWPFVFGILVLRCTMRTLRWASRGSKAEGSGLAADLPALGGAVSAFHISKHRRWSAQPC